MRKKQYGVIVSSIIMSLFLGNVVFAAYWNDIFGCFNPDINGACDIDTNTTLCGCIWEGTHLDSLIQNCKNEYEQTLVPSLPPYQQQILIDEGIKEKLFNNLDRLESIEVYFTDGTKSFDNYSDLNAVAIYVGKLFGGLILKTPEDFATEKNMDVTTYTNDTPEQKKEKLKKAVAKISLFDPVSRANLNQHIENDALEAMTASGEIISSGKRIGVCVVTVFCNPETFEVLQYTKRNVVISTFSRGDKPLDLPVSDTMPTPTP
jgi:hypothetical protein